MKLIYLTGISGSGKSTLAESLAEEIDVVSGDRLVRGFIDANFPTMNQIAPGKVAKILRDYRELFNDPADSMESELRKLINLDSALDLLIESIHLKDQFWDDMISTSLASIYGFEVKPSLFVFHNPPAKVIHSQYTKRRCEKRGSAPERSLEFFVERKIRWSKQLNRVSWPVEEFDSHEKSRKRISEFVSH